MSAGNNRMRAVTQASPVASPRLAARRFASRSQAHPARGEPLAPQDSATLLRALSKTHPPRRPASAPCLEEHNAGPAA